MRTSVPMIAICVLFSLGCGNLLGSDSPVGDTADPRAPSAEAPADAPSEDPADDGDGTADAEPEDGGPQAGEGDGDAPPARPRRRRRRGKPSNEPGGGPDNAPAEETPEEVEPEPEPEPQPKGPPTTKPKGVTQTGDTTWLITKRNFDRWKDDPYALGNVSQEGEGWSLIYVRKREGWHLGMRNKDVIMEINGKKLKNKAQLLATYLALKNKTEFDVKFTRKGKTRTHHYSVKE